MFIVLEGITSTGKTTNGKRLTEYFKAHGIKAIFNHEPSPHTPFGKLMRCLIERRGCQADDIVGAEALANSIDLQPLKEVLQKIKQNEELTELELQLMFIADRREDLLGTIRPALKAGFTCVQDRYELSTYAFAAARGVAFNVLHKIQMGILRGAYVVPDVLIYFDLAPEIAIERLTVSQKLVDRYETLLNIRKTKTAYEELLKRGEFYRTLHIIDASLPLDNIFELISKKLNKLNI